MMSRPRHCSASPGLCSARSTASAARSQSLRTLTRIQQILNGRWSHLNHFQR